MWNVLIGLALMVAPSALAQAPGRDRVSARLAALESALIDFRRDLHRHPETSGNEERTAGIVAARLRALGLEVKSGVGGHGVIAILRGGKPGPLVAFRADMDAFPSGAPDPVEFRSTIPGVRHICGHDIHTTIGVALAEAFAAVRRDLPGAVMLIFQPAEEQGTGAKAMLAEGIFKSEKPVAIFAVHTAPFETGQLATVPGGMMAGRDNIRITLEGSGNRAAAAATLRAALGRLGTIPADRVLEPAAEGFVYMHLVPGDSTTITAIATMASREARERTRAAVANLASELAVPGVTAHAEYEAKMMAGVDNDPDLLLRASRAITVTLGAGTVVPLTIIVPAFSEDFGSFQDEVPGVMYFLGVANAAKGWRGYPHSPDYVADERAIQVGARAMAAAILDRLSTP